MKDKAKYIIGGVILLVIIAAVAGGGSDTSTDNTAGNSESSSSESAPAESVAKIGTAVRDGKFEFIIKSMDCSKTSVGSEFLTEEAQGKFCILDITVKNIGDVAQTFISSEQKLVNSEGQQFSNDIAAEISIDVDSNTWLEDINPGNFVAGKVVFDVPADATIVKAELHDSAFSDGIEVDLTQ